MELSTLTRNFLVSIWRLFKVRVLLINKRKIFKISLLNTLIPIKPKMTALNLKKTKFSVPPDLINPKSPKKFGWKEFILGGVIVESSVYLLT